MINYNTIRQDCNRIVILYNGETTQGRKRFLFSIGICNKRVHILISGNVKGANYSRVSGLVLFSSAVRMKLHTRQQYALCLTHTSDAHKSMDIKNE